MTEQEMRFVENQFKKIGIAEGFSSELSEKLKRGDKLIEHQFKKNYDGDEAIATFRLKKADSSNSYFLNAFDLTVRKDGQTNEVNRLFYMNNFRRSDEESKFQNAFYTTFTFKEAFNYLSGRPVLKTFENQKNEKYQSWELRNPKTGDERHYHENYGFDLMKVLNNYSIRELTNSEFKERLLQSLQRGNLQSVTFVGKGGEKEKLFISPDIPLGALKIYDQNKTRVPTPALVEKEYIGKELAEKIQQRIALNAQNGRQTQRQDQKVKPENNEQIKNDEPRQNLKKTQNQKDEGLVKKQSKKHKQKLN